MSYGEPTTFVGDVTGTGHTPITLTMSPSGVAAGVYGGSGAIPVITVDAKGRITNVSTAPPGSTPNLTQSFVVAVADASLPNARVLKSGPGIDIADMGPSGLVVSHDRNACINFPTYYEPFWGGANSYYIQYTSGNGSVSARTGTAAKPGGITLSVKDAGNFAVYACSPTMLVFGGGVAVDFQTAVSVNNVTHSSNNRYVFRVGFIDSTNGNDATDGVYFEFDSNWTTTGWEICTSSNSIRTKIDTGIVPGDEDTLYFNVSADGSLVSFYINGVNVGTIQTNIPNTPGRETGLCMQLYKYANNTVRTVDVMYMFFQAGV